MRYIFQTTIPVIAFGHKITNLLVTVEYNHEPATGDGWNEPKYPAEIEIVSVIYDGEDIQDELSADERERIESEIWEDVYKLGELAAEMRIERKLDAMEEW